MPVNVPYNLRHSEPFRLDQRPRPLHPHLRPQRNLPGSTEVEGEGISNGKRSAFQFLGQCIQLCWGLDVGYTGEVDAVAHFVVEEELDPSAEADGIAHFVLQEDIDYSAEADGSDQSGVEEEGLDQSAEAGGIDHIVAGIGMVRTVAGDYIDHTLAVEGMVVELEREDMPGEELVLDLGLLVQVEFGIQEREDMPGLGLELDLGLLVEVEVEVGNRERVVAWI